MNHITDYFKKFAAIAEGGKSKKRAVAAVCNEFNVPIFEDAVEIKGNTARVFCTTAQATILKTNEEKLVQSCRAKNISVARIIPIMVA